jgi:hypothetical protein
MHSTRLQLAALLGCVLLALPTLSAAIPVTHNFSVKGIDGPLAGVESWGSFSYDSSIMPLSGTGLVGGSATNFDFVLNWGGTTYTESQIKSGGILFAGGQFAGALFGTVCRTDFSCVLAPLPLGALFVDMSTSPLFPGLFSYNLDGTQRIGTVRMKAVPEPSTTALLCLALLGVATFRYRSRRRFGRADRLR